MIQNVKKMIANRLSPKDRKRFNKKVDGYHVDNKMLIKNFKICLLLMLGNHSIKYRGLVCSVISKLKNDSITENYMVALKSSIFKFKSYDPNTALMLDVFFKLIESDNLMDCLNGLAALMLHNPMPFWYEISKLFVKAHRESRIEVKDESYGLHVAVCLDRVTGG